MTILNENYTLRQLLLILILRRKGDSMLIDINGKKTSLKNDDIIIYDKHTSTIGIIRNYRFLHWGAEESKLDDKYFARFINNAHEFQCLVRLMAFLLGLDIKSSENYHEAHAFQMVSHSDSSRPQVSIQLGVGCIRIKGDIMYDEIPAPYLSNQIDIHLLMFFLINLDDFRDQITSVQIKP